MKAERFNSITPTYAGKGLQFNSHVGGRDVGICVDQETLFRLVEVSKTAGAIGHALWHIENPDSKFPCEACNGNY